MLKLGFYLSSIAVTRSFASAGYCASTSWSMGDCLAGHGVSVSVGGWGRHITVRRTSKH